MQEDLEYRSVALVIRGTKVTQQTLAKAMAVTLRKMKSANKGRGANASEQHKEGKQSIKQLSKGGSLSNIEITDGNIKSFDPIARKYGISYALQKDSSSDPPRWMVFFKAKDVDAMTAAFKEYSAKALKKEANRESVRDTMKKFREVAKNVTKNVVLERVKSKDRGELER